MIQLHNSIFYAPLDSAYASSLSLAGWHRGDQFYYTDDIKRVVPFVEHLCPQLKAILVENSRGYEESKAETPSEGFTAPVPEGKTLFPFQLAAVEYILKRPDTLLAEDAGLGKSAIMTTVANALNVKSVLIICPAIAKYNWMDREWPKWTTLQHLKVGVVEANDWPEGADVVIINYDILERHKKRLNSHKWDLLLVDESHRVKNEDAKRTIMVLGGVIKQKKDEASSSGGDPLKANGKKYRYYPIPAEKRVFATATPMNRPRDLWTVCKTFDPQGLGANKKKFEQRYCAAYETLFGWDNSGADNLEELGARMRSTFMVRHRAEDVTDLPPLREEFFLMPPVKAVASMEREFVSNNIEALMSLARVQGKTLSEESTYEEVAGVIGEALYNNVHLIGKPEFAPMFTEYASMRKNVGIAKLPAIIEYINETTNDLETPIVIFGYHREVLLALKDAFPDAAMVIGGISAKERSRQVDRFQNGETNIFLGNMDAAGEAVTLTRANHLAFCELDWRGTALIQARKRIHRLTQDQPCLVSYLCAARSFDSILSNVAFEKISNIQETIDF